MISQNSQISGQIESLQRFLADQSAVVAKAKGTIVRSDRDAVVQQIQAFDALLELVRPNLIEAQKVDERLRPVLEAFQAIQHNPSIEFYDTRGRCAWLEYGFLKVIGYLFTGKVYVGVPHPRPIEMKLPPPSSRSDEFVPGEPSVAAEPAVPSPAILPPEVSSVSSPEVHAAPGPQPPSISSLRKEMSETVDRSRICEKEENLEKIRAHVVVEIGKSKSAFCLITAKSDNAFTVTVYKGYSTSRYQLEINKENGTEVLILQERGERSTFPSMTDVYEHFNACTPSEMISTLQLT